MQWPSTDDEQRGIIASAMNIYHEQTCIRFVPHTDERDYIQIQSISGCSSLIGQVEEGGPQPVSLDINGCVRTDIVQHELMHAAGFWVFLFIIYYSNIFIQKCFAARAEPLRQRRLRHRSLGQH